MSEKTLAEEIDLWCKDYACQVDGAGQALADCVLYNQAKILRALELADSLSEPAKRAIESPAKRIAELEKHLRAVLDRSPLLRHSGGCSSVLNPATNCDCIKPITDAARTALEGQGMKTTLGPLAQFDVKAVALDALATAVENGAPLDLLREDPGPAHLTRGEMVVARGILAAINDTVRAARADTEGKENP